MDENLANGATGYYYVDITNGATRIITSPIWYTRTDVATSGPEYFRTVTTGNWNSTSTWESSADNSTWHAATTTPDYNSNTITILTGHTVTITANVSTDETTINAGGALVVSPNVVLTINDGTGADLTVSNGSSMTIRSTSAGTGSIGNSAGTVAGNVTIERYIPARRAWRFLSAPVSSTGAPTINASWQEGATTASVTPNPNPGYGTHITGGTTANGFDQNSSNNPSLKIYNNSSTTIDENNWVGGPSSTLTPITSQPGYMLFVRGSRANNLSQGSAAVADNTTLRITGQIKSGTQNNTIAATGYSVVGNPYASPIDLNSLAKTNGSTNIADNFYVWDPKMTGSFGVGAYVNISWNGSSYNITPAPVSPVSQFIQSGEAFFATSTGTAGNLVIKETDKSASGSDNVFRVTAPKEQKISTNLYSVNTDGSTSILDGTLNTYSSAFSNAIDKYDAKKLTNFGENIGLIRNGETFIVERRQAIGDTINFKIWNMNERSYQLEVVVENIDPTNLTAYLHDRYLKTFTPINLNGNTSVKFSITSDALSSAENRFAIEFGKPALVQTGNPSIMVYPNPVYNGTINLRMDNMPQGKYNIRLLNSVGQTILQKQIDHVAGSSIETLITKGKSGVFHVEVTKPDHTKFISKVIAY